MESTLARNARTSASPRRRTAPSAESLPERFREAASLLLVGVSVFLIAAVATYRVDYVAGSRNGNVCGSLGHALAHAAILTLGTAAYVPLAFAATWSLILFLRGRIDAPLVKALGVLVLTLALAVILEHTRPLGDVPGDVRGGLVGVTLAPRIASGFGPLGTYLVLGVLGAIAFTMATDFVFYPLVVEALRGARGAAREAKLRADEMRVARGWRERAAALLPTWLRRRSAKKPKKTAALAPLLSKEGVEAELRAAKFSEPAAAPPASDSVVVIPRIDLPSPAVTGAPAQNAAPTAKSDRRVKNGDLTPTLPFPAAPYSLPEPRLLDETPKRRRIAGGDEVAEMAIRIESVLRSFEVEVKVVGASRGPAVTLFELEMGEGVKVNQLTARTHDLAIKLKSGGVRFVYPIPGKSTVGVEVPNTHREFVRLRELVDEVPPKAAKAAVPLYLGRDVMNRAVVEDLAEMPHLLIAGQTGSGKSACLNAILCSVLLGRSPDDVKLILVDPKQVEFSKYEGIPHLMCPIVTIARKVPIVLDWVIVEMEQRYEQLAMAGVRKISDYNVLGKRALKERLGEGYDAEETPTRIPYLIVIVDEMNDLMIQAKKDMEDRITRIAQKSRAVGIHLILATQRPSVNVITGTIKANLPTRIAFQTAQGNDSRVILDQIGAEDLLGKGDFLFKPPGTDKFVRAQGTWVGDEEIERLVKHAKTLAEPRYDIRLVQIKDAPDQPEGGEPAEASFDGGRKDTLFVQAVEETLKANRAAASHLQRAFSIGYNRATRILDAMAALAIVSSYEGSKVRRILITPEEWSARKADILSGALKSRGVSAPPAEISEAEAE